MIEREVLVEGLGSAWRFMEPTANKYKVFLNAFKPGDTRHEAPLFKAHLSKQGDAGIVASKDGRRQGFDAQRWGLLDGLTNEVGAYPFALIVWVKVDRDVGGDEVTRPLVYEVEEAKVTDDAKIRGCVVFSYPKWSVIRRVLQESWATCLYRRRVEVATALSCSDREVVDLDDPGQIGFGRIAVCVGHSAQYVEGR